MDFVYIVFQIKDDPKNGLYVEKLTEEYVTSYEDVMQILIKVGERSTYYFTQGSDLMVHIVVCLKFSTYDE